MFFVTWFGWCVLKLPPASGAVWSTGETQKRRSLGLCIFVNVLSVLNAVQSILYDVQ